MRIHIVHEMHPRRTGRWAPSGIDQRIKALAAKAGTAGAKDDDIVEICPVARRDGAKNRQVVPRRGQCQQRQPAITMPVAYLRQRPFRFGQEGGKQRIVKPRRSD